MREALEDIGQSEQVRAVVLDPSQVGEARRTAHGVALALGFDETTAGKASIVMTELASNLIKHARGGELLLRAAQGGIADAGVLEVLSLDTGPGVADVGKAMRDGYSTAGSPGSGLGAVQRLASEFDLYSLPGRGTCVLARLSAHANETPILGSTVQVGAVRVAHAHERVCGDDWAHRRGRNLHTFVVADGLGHGESAAAAASAAIGVLRGTPALAPGLLLEAMHERLRSTRGAAVLVVQIDTVRAVARYAGLGNVAGVLFDGARGRHLVSQGGIVGHEARRIQEVELPCSADWLLVMHSDGIGTRWDLSQYPGLLPRDPSVIAAVLYRDHKRGRDDATVIVAKGRNR